MRAAVGDDVEDDGRWHRTAEATGGVRVHAEAHEEIASRIPAAPAFRTWDGVGAVDALKGAGVVRPIAFSRRRTSAGRPCIPTGISSIDFGQGACVFVAGVIRLLRRATVVRTRRLSWDGRISAGARRHRTSCYESQQDNTPSAATEA